MSSRKRITLGKGRPFAAAFLCLFLFPLEAFALKCSPPDLRKELTREGDTPTVLFGALQNITDHSAWFTPVEGAPFELRLKRHSAGSFTASLPPSDTPLLLLAKSDDRGLFVDLHVCNTAIFEADDAALALVRKYNTATPN